MKSKDHEKIVAVGGIVNSVSAFKEPWMGEPQRFSETVGWKNRALFFTLKNVGILKKLSCQSNSMTS